MRKEQIANLVIINLILGLLALLSKDYPIIHFTTIEVLDFILSFILFFLGSFLFIYSPSEPSSKWFFIVLHITGWILILPAFPFAYPLYLFLVCVSAPALFQFFISFIKVDHTKLAKNILTILVGLSLILYSALLLNFDRYSFLFFILLLLTIAATIFLSLTNNFKQRAELREYQYLLIGSFLFSLLPLILTHIFQIQPLILRQLSPYFILIFPLTFSYILIKQHKLQTDFDYLYFALHSIAIFLVFFLFCMLSIYFVNISIIKTLVMLLFITILFYFFNIIQHYFLRRQLQRISDSKESFEYERHEIFHQVTYDNYLSSLYQVIEKIIFQITGLTDFAIIWKEDGYNFIMHQVGAFELAKLTPHINQQLKPFPSNISSHLLICSAFPLRYEGVSCGWILFKQTTEELIVAGNYQQACDIADTLSQTLKNTELLYENHKRYLHLPNISYEEQYNINFTRNVEASRLELSHYLHDDVLQLILALKYLTETLETPQDDIKKIILANFDELNASLRNKMFDLYPSTLSDLGLEQSIHILLDKLVSTRYNNSRRTLTINFTCEIENQLSKNVQLSIFRITRELVQNVLKHAEATKIEISLLSDTRYISIVVTDDGIGFDPNLIPALSQNGDHFGLLSIKQEVGLLKGSFALKNIILESQTGLTVKIKIPII
ncbi:hypothetical protein AwErysi_02930 [Erysipelotrichaceae bacterium]|nr:hypothetical protein AwErysi_02930 [Erysipelotrichaceae bacterium]